MTRLYHVVSIRNDNGYKTYMTATPCTHKEARTIMAKLTVHAFRRIQIEEVTK